jgi:ribosomal protein S18 acetylase RimI-like enzyme
LRPDVVVRPLRDEDTDAIVALYDRATATEPGIGPVPRSAWQRFVKQPQNRNGRDFRVALQEGRLIGVAESSLKDQGEHVVRFCKLVVDPTARRQGVATELIIDLLKIDQSGGSLSFQFLVSSDWPAGLAFLETLGLTHIESEMRMRCSHLMPPPGAISSAFSLARVANPASHAAEVARIHNAAYRTDVAFRPYTTEDMADALGGDELWVAREGLRTVAFCRLELEPKFVWLESLAVDPDCHDIGLGTALAYQALQAAGVSVDRPAGLNVSSKNLRAMSVYARLGFATRGEMRRFSALRCDLAAAMERHRNRTY